MNPVARTRRLDERTRSILSEFDDGFDAILAKAQVRTTARLREALDLVRGVVRPTAANVRVIRSLPTIFRQVLMEEGYEDLVDEFTGSFDGGLSTFEAILSDITGGFKIDPVTFTKDDLTYFASMKGMVANELDTVVEEAGAAARRNVAFSMAGDSFEKTAAAVAERLHVASSEASTLAATGISTFYRTIADKGYAKVEDALPVGSSLEFTYAGPPAGDKLIRPFCQRLMAMAQGGRTWTRGQIDSMDNDQLPDVFRTGGGFNCRHQWVVALEHSPGWRGAAGRAKGED